MSVGVVIPAAGLGKRMKSKDSKPFLNLMGRPVLLYTLEVFEAHSEVDQIVVVTKESEVERVRSLVQKENISKVTAIVPGGSERQDSVRLGLQYCDTEWVLVHDGVRPFVTAHSISRLLQTVKMHGAAILAVPVKDTMKMVNDAGIVEETPDRSRLWAVQTPQAFRRDWLLKAHEWALEQTVAATDDAMLVEEMGLDVRVVEGDYTNIKLTTPEDMVMAEAILRMRGYTHDADRTGV